MTLHAAHIRGLQVALKATPSSEQMSGKKGVGKDAYHSDQVLIPHIFNRDIIHQPTDDRPRAFGFAQVDLFDVQSICIGVFLNCWNPLTSASR
jgi:hypothetical protein